MGHTPGPWFVGGVRFRMNGGEWHSVNRYDEGKKSEENIACVGYDPRTGAGFGDAHLIAAAPDLLEALKEMKELFRFALLSTSVEIARDAKPFLDKADAAVAKAEGH